MDKGIYDDRVFLTRELDQTWHRKTPGSQTINPAGDLNNVAAYLDSPQLREAHANIAEELKKAHVEFAQSMADFPETHNRIISISETGSEFIHTRPDLYKTNLAIYSDALKNYAIENPTRTREDVFKKLDTNKFFVGVDKADAEAMARAKALADEATANHKVKLRTRSPCA
ncbi:hypothetical protein HDV02_003752 [Globomyces sp. JEL0801]|nr:hypothetical protein HDV02_003752 [Globomyces sp. JEL0801]